MRHAPISPSLLMLLAAGVVLPQVAFSATITVPAGTTVSQQVLANGDLLEVEAGGTVEDTADAVDDVADFTTLTIINRGSIVSLGNQAIDTWSTVSLTNSGAISGLMGGVTAETFTLLENSGLIESTNGNHAVFVGTIGILDNSGTISGVETGILNSTTFDLLINSGVVIGGNGAGATSESFGTVVNSGTIAGMTYGILAFNGDIGSLGNSGTITGLGTGVFAQSATIDNSGHIGGLLAAIDLSGTLDLGNSGTIGANSGPAISADAIHVLDNSGGIKGANAIVAKQIEQIVNSGVIAGETPAFFAIDEDTGTGVDTILTLKAGSIIVGRVDISAGNDTLRVGDGLNLALTFDTSVPELIETGGNPYVVVGNTVHVVDLAAVAAATDIVLALGNGIGGVVGTALRTGFDEKGAGGEGNYWLEGFGMAGQRSGARQLVGGLVAGVDFGPDADTRLGVLAGLGKGFAGADVESFYAGIYGAAQLEDFSAEGTLIAGLTRTDRSRIVANNTVVGGLETAIGVEDAFFIAPQITLRRGFVSADMILDASLTLGYTGVFGGGYTETGVTTPLTVDAGASHNFGAKALLGLPFAVTDGPGVLTGDVRGGVVVDVFAGDGARGSLGGTPLVLGAGGPSFSAGLTGGMAIDYEFPGGATFFGAIDGTIHHDLSHAIVGEVGIKGAF